MHTVRSTTGVDTSVRHEIWYAADVFTSLVDNIQETFGLTPVEAMAAGLPVVVTDWDGYRDTVEEGVQGFLIPTTMPRANAIGQELARRFFQKIDNYDHYIANAANSVAVDIEATTARYLALVEDAALRTRMGQAGRVRAETVYDWKHIMQRYQSLWAELAQIRQETIPRVLPSLVSHQDVSVYNPMAPDPFFVFQGYPTHTLQVSTPLWLMGEDVLDRTQEYLQLGIIGAGLKEPDAVYKTVIEQLIQNPGLTLGNLMSDSDAARQQLIERCVARLVKLGLLRITHEADSRILKGAM